MNTTPTQPSSVGTGVLVSASKLVAMTAEDEALHCLRRLAEPLRSHSEPYWASSKNEWAFWLRPYAKGKAGEQMLALRLQQIFGCDAVKCRNALKPPSPADLLVGPESMPIEIKTLCTNFDKTGSESVTITITHDDWKGLWVTVIRPESSHYYYIIRKDWQAHTANTNTKRRKDTHPSIGISYPRNGGDGDMFEGGNWESAIDKLAAHTKLKRHNPCHVFGLNGEPI